MTTLPPGYSSLGPFYIETEKKEKFVNRCKALGKKMETVFKELIDREIGNGKEIEKTAPEEVGNAAK